MTTRDPRSRPPSPSEAQGIGRDPTVSLDIPIDETDGEPRDLALGTHEVGRNARTKLTEVASPAARVKTPLPARGNPPQPPPIPRAATDEPDRVGAVLGSYRILELLGRGGMGYVFRAEHTKLGREVALKLLRGDYARRRDAVARFFQEARTVNRVRHRNIVDVTDFVELEDGTTFIIMELLRGDSLGKWARSGIDLPRALAVLVQICDGLAAAHEVGVIHRDLKPDNVIVVPTTDGAELVKLLDFGVAKLVNRDDEDIAFETAAGSVIGTPAYMSPEQAGGMAVDGRADIYSLGAIMYELFCGQPMFRGRSFGEYVRKHLTEMPVPPRQTPGGAQIDPRLDALIMRCLEKDPFLRFPNIVELRDALLAMLGGMETFLPGLASLTGSGMRAVASGVSVRLSPMPQLPLAVPMSGAYGSQSHASHASHPSQQVYFNQTVPPTGVSAPTPLWVWIVGAAIAIGLGIVGAVWYASRGGDLPPTPVAGPAKPTVSQPAPIAEPITPPPAAQLVEIKLESTPPGAVFAEGNPSRLCTTPCTHTIDPKDGGSPDQRTFVVRSDGYKESQILVDLRGSQRDFAVTLEALPEEPVATPGPTADKGARPGVKPAIRTVRGVKRPGKRPDEQTGKPEDKKPDDRSAKPDNPDLIDPSEGRPTRKPDRKPGPIDPTDTLDPFRPKK